MTKKKKNTRARVQLTTKLCVGDLSVIPIVDTQSKVKKTCLQIFPSYLDIDKTLVFEISLLHII